MNAAKPLLIPVAYVLPWSRYKNAEPWMRAEVKARKFGEDGTPSAWAIVEGGCVLAKDGEWEIEPQPSSRTEDFFTRTRFATAEEAASFAAKHFPSTPEATK